MTNSEKALYAILSDNTTVDIDIISRIDEYLVACCKKSGCENLPTPITRIDKLLYQLAAKLHTTTGGNKLPLVLGGEATVLTAADLEGCTALRVAAFEYYYTLTSIDIPQSVTSIGTACFSWCTSLKKVVIPTSVTQLAVNVFNECKGLETLTLHEGIKSIGENAFRNVGTTTTAGLILTMKAKTPPTIAANTFEGTKLNKIVVPTGTGATYKAAANWASLANYITEG